MEKQKNIAVLGATGSIGSQTLDIIERARGRYRASVLTAGSKADALIAAAVKHRPDLAIIADESKYRQVAEALQPLGIKVEAGAKALEDAVVGENVDMVLTATVGYSGLAPTLAAIRAGKDIALANKETMVVAGELVTRLLGESASKIYPVDSEHSAIFQCMQGEEARDVRRLIITASGGPFRTWTAEQIAKATARDALKHPNWNMGAKITIDSATMLNKAFEIIEARWLFGMPPEKITAVVHPQSIVHSMIEFADGAIKAQLGTPDMRLPIAYALGETARHDYSLPALTIDKMASLTFTEPDTEKFPCISLAYHALEKGGNVACVVNAANEIAVAAFLRDDIRYTDIYPLIRHTLEKMPFIAAPTYDDYVQTNAEARHVAEEEVKSLCR